MAERGRPIVVHVAKDDALIADLIATGCVRDQFRRLTLASIPNRVTNNLILFLGMCSGEPQSTAEHMLFRIVLPAIKAELRRRGH